MPLQVEERVHSSDRMMFGGVWVLVKQDLLGRGCMQTIHTVEPQKALCGGIPSPFLEPSPRSWSHFVGVYRQILTTSLKT